MGNTLVKNRQLNYLVTFFLVLMLSLSLAACGSTSGDGSANTTEDPKDDKKIPTILTNYEISGFGQIEEGAYFGTFLQLDNVTLSGGDIHFSDWLVNRVDFTGTSIKSISVTGNTATIIADGTVTDEYGATFSGSIELIITDGNTDMFSIKINDTSGNEMYNMPSQSIDMVSGDFIIT